jgi:hypothetical protein
MLDDHLLRLIRIVSINSQNFPPINTEKFPVWELGLLFFERFFLLLKPVGIVTGFENIAVMGNAIQQDVK